MNGNTEKIFLEFVIFQEHFKNSNKAGNTYSMEILASYHYAKRCNWFKMNTETKLYFYKFLRPCQRNCEYISQCITRVKNYRKGETGRCKQCSQSKLPKLLAK